MKHLTPLELEVRTMHGRQKWSLVTVSEVPLGGPSQDWVLLADLPAAAQQLIKSLRMDHDARFPGIVNGKLCAIIEQEFQASDSGDDWPETADEVTQRLLRQLLPSLSLHETPSAQVGVLGGGALTFQGRPTVWVVVPAEHAQADKLHRLEEQLRAFAYPERLAA
jgi:hypothetical protein